MKSTLSIFVATILLLASNSAEAARGTAAANRNQGMAPIPQISTAAPQTNPIGGTNRMVQAQSGAPWTPTTLPRQSSTLAKPFMETRRFWVRPTTLDTSQLRMRPVHRGLLRRLSEVISPRSSRSPGSLSGATRRGFNDETSISSDASDCLANFRKRAEFREGTPSDCKEPGLPCMRRPA